MKLSEIIDVIGDDARIRIIQGKRGNRDPERDPNIKILFSNCKALMRYTDSATEFLIKDPEVIRFVAFPEIRHREFKERGFFPPYEPDITRMYEFKDLTMVLYYDIYI